MHRWGSNESHWFFLPVHRYSGIIRVLRPARYKRPTCLKPCFPGWTMARLPRASSPTVVEVAIQRTRTKRGVKSRIVPVKTNVLQTPPPTPQRRSQPSTRQSSWMRQEQDDDPPNNIFLDLLPARKGAPQVRWLDQHKQCR